MTTPAAITTDHPAVSIERHDAPDHPGAVVVVTMDDGRANALATDLGRALIDVVDQVDADDTARALVLAGRDGRFSAGFDLGVFQTGDLAAVGEMVGVGGHLVRRLYGCGVPVVAACTGHAVAAGALLLLGCDRRIGPAAPVKIGLNEVAIGLQLPDWAMAIAADRLSRRHLQASVVNARLYDGEGAVDAGFLDLAVDPAEVVATAIAEATGMVALDPTAYAGTVGALRGAILERMATTTNP